MTIIFTGNRGLSNRPLVKEILQVIENNPQSFPPIARVFSIYKNKEAASLTEVQRQARNFFLLASLSPDESGKLIDILSEIYQSSKFNEIRAEILENVVCLLGPITNELSFKQCFVEPIIKDGDAVIGKSDKKCDLVFYNTDSDPIEFVECKVNISNVVPWNLPFERTSKTHRDKILYLEHAYDYLKENYVEPKIYFACYNLDYERELNNLQVNWGYNFISFANPLEIMNSKYG